MKLSGYDLHFDFERGTIEVVKAPGVSRERAVTITIQVTKTGDRETLLDGLEHGLGVILDAEVTVKS